MTEGNCVICFNAGVVSLNNFALFQQCATCRLVIGAKDQGVTWKDLNWHATPHCFRCNSCQNSLLGGRFAVKDQRPFCSKECMQAGTSSNHQKVTSV